MSCHAARYATLEEYILQFGAPQFWLFTDPITPELSLVVECQQEDLCEQCHQPLDLCACAF